MLQKGDVIYADLNNSIGSVQNGIRPVVIISNDIYNKHSDNLQIVPISSSIGNVRFSHVLIEGEEEKECGLKRNSKVICDTIQTISKTQAFQKVGQVSNNLKEIINEKIKVQLAL